jgi:hypothetical protein
MLCAIVEIVSPGLFKWTLYDGTTLYEQSNSYMVTCADGTHGNVQACADLNAMFNVLGCPRLPWGAIPCAPPMFPSPSPSP